MEDSASIGTALKVTRAAGALGAYVEGVDVRDALRDDDLFAQLREVALRYEVIFLRGQDVPAVDFQAFACRFGTVLDHPAYGTVADAPLVQILESTAERPSKIEEWHSDMTFSATPPSFTILHGQIIPEYGGDTLWASATAAYDALSPALKALLKERRAVHDFRHGFKESLAEPGGEDRLADAIATNPPVSHPLVRTHPETGRKALYVNPLFTTHIEGLTLSESEHLLTFLYQHCVTHEFSVRLRWAPGTIVVWDNRAVLHKPVNDFHPQHRKLHRITIQGDTPA
ncbi:MAG: TauD/TfdA family dioxygenase [Pseudomonadota bacterium]